GAANSKLRRLREVRLAIRANVADLKLIRGCAAGLLGERHGDLAGNAAARDVQLVRRHGRRDLPEATVLAGARRFAELVGRNHEQRDGLDPVEGIDQLTIDAELGVALPCYALRKLHADNPPQQHVAQLVRGNRQADLRPQQLGYRNADQLAVFGDDRATRVSG